jgi:hypothetical protein
VLQGDDLLLADMNTKLGQNCVAKVDSEALVKNLEKPFIFITSKNYADRLQSNESQHSEFL